MTQPCLILIAGSIGAGKTTLAYGLKKENPDFVIIENDTIRRELLGFPLNYFMNHNLDDSFSEENNKRVLDTMDQRTKAALDAGHTVIRTHVVVKENDLKRFQNEYNIPLVSGIYLLAPENIIRQRIRIRQQERDSLDVLSVEKGHASDADEGVLEKFPVLATAPDNWTVIDATLSVEYILDQTKALIANLQ